jgi:hypothetical protein
MLANLQKLVVRMTVDPCFADAVYRKDGEVLRASGTAEEEWRLVQQIPASVIEDFQKSIAVDRVLLRGYPVLNRTFTMLGTERTRALLHQYITEHVMLRNEWEQHLGEFQRFVLGQLGTTPEEERVREVLRFEQMLYDIKRRDKRPVPSGKELYLSPDARCGEFSIDPEVLADESLSREEILAGFGEPRKLLVQMSGDVLNVFELEELQYQILKLCQEPVTYAELKRRVPEEARDMMDQFLDELWEIGLLSGERE